ncbi:DUF2993 domain-containing protein [Streptomyces sp. NPDC051940]|uniref:LmeA family phospholipid-binding protein n=1 Tax=Streptomyces sp. NPDC051940 TaxID=3155675 RepID=UPI0034393E28
MRGLRILLILVSLFAIVFVVADRVVVGVAEDEAADRIQARQGIAGDTTVSIRGFPFLTQVLSKHLDLVELHLSDVQAASGRDERGRVVISEMSATLRDIRLGSGFGSAVAGTAEGHALIGYDQLRQQSGERLKVTYSGDERLKVTADIEVNGRTVATTVTAEIEVTGGDAIRLRVVDGDGAVDAARRQIGFTQPVAGLPGGLTLKNVTPTADGLNIGLTGRDVSLTS